MPSTRASTRATRAQGDSFAAAAARLRALPRVAHPPVSDVGRAAVLVALFPDPCTGEARLLLTQRTAHLSSHAGEVCLPGGRRDDGDAHDADTALREAAEETGLDPAAAAVVAHMRPVLSKHLLSVAPVVALLPCRPALTLNPAEVDAAFDVPLSLFLDSGPAHHHRDARFGGGGPPFRLHFFDHSDPDTGRAFTVWGLTAGIAVDVATAALGRAPEFQVHPSGARPYSDIVAFGGRKPRVREGGGMEGPGREGTSN